MKIAESAVTENISGITVRKALADDFDSIYPLLLEFGNHDLSKEGWRQLFVKHCPGAEDYFGYVLLDRETPIGFLGLIFSRRTIDGKEQKFGNMTSWIIKNKYRGRGLSRVLFDELLKLEDHTITTMPPSPKTERMHRASGFRVLEDKYRLIPPFFTFEFFNSGCTLLTDPDAIKDCLNGRERQIYDSHNHPKCRHIVIKGAGRICYLIVKTARRNGLPFTEVHYISDLPFFIKSIGQVRLKLPWAMKTWGIVIEERFLKGYDIVWSYLRRFHRDKLFKSKLLNNGSLTDNLYTEVLLLDI